MRVIIAGGRDFNDFDFLDKETVKIMKLLRTEGINVNVNNISIVSGEASGADTLGEKFADKYGIRVDKHPAKWNDLDAIPCKIKTNRYGKEYNALAGFNRNRDMALFAKEDEEIGVLIAFWDKKSHGTKDMIDLGNKYGLRVFIVEY